MEDKIRTAQAFIEAARTGLRDEWDKYGDVQIAFQYIEEASRQLDILLSKCLIGTLK